MTYAPWTIREFLGPQKAADLLKRCAEFANEDQHTKLKTSASLLYTSLEQLANEGYMDPNKFGMDEYRYWDEEDLKETNEKRKDFEKNIMGEPAAMDVLAKRRELELRREKGLAGPTDDTVSGGNGGEAMMG